MHKFYSRIEFWIFIFFLIRLIGITNPPLEIGHNWRQVTGLMVARNFHEVDANILYPRIDDNSGNTGIIGMEFPTMNYLVFMISNVFGYAHWYGRLVNLIVSSFGLFFFYKLICLAKFNEHIAFISTIFLASSIWFSFSRKMMPDTYCISIMFIALFYGLRYLEEKKGYQIVLYLIFASIAVLSKIPAGIYFVIPALFLLKKSIGFKEKVILIVSSILSLVLVYLWYFRWNFKLQSTFGTWYNSGKSIHIGFFEIAENLGDTLDNFYFDAFSGFIVFILFGVGVVFMFINKERNLISAFLMLLAVFVLYMFKSGFYFYHQNYYIIPFVPVMALLAGYALSLVQKKAVVVSILLLGTGESIANQQHDFFIKKSEQYKMSLEQIMDKISKKDDLILLNGNENPQLLYLSHRKGWICKNEQLYNNLFVNEVMNKGCKFLVVDKHAGVDLSLLARSFVVFENDDFLIMNLSLGLGS